MDILKEKLTEVLTSGGAVEERLLQICQVLDSELPHFNWTGFYFKNGDKDELILGPYVGEPTDHRIIPYGRGICGQVAVSGETFLVPDVHAQENYLSCSADTKSEIVVPIFKNGENIGQIDIDSHTANAFNDGDRELLEWLCEELGAQL